MMYEVLSGKRFEFEVDDEIEFDRKDDTEFMVFADWPTADKLPSTRDVFLYDIISRCWQNLKDGSSSM